MRLGNVKAHIVHTLSTPPCAHSLCAHPRVHTSRCAHPRVHTPACTLCAHFAHTLCTLCAHPCVHAPPVCTPLCAHPGRVVHHPVCTPRVCCCCCCYQVLPTTQQLLLLLLLLHFRRLSEQRWSECPAPCKLERRADASTTAVPGEPLWKIILVSRLRPRFQSTLTDEGLNSHLSKQCAIASSRLGNPAGAVPKPNHEPPNLCNASSLPHTPQLAHTCAALRKALSRARSC